MAEDFERGLEGLEAGPVTTPEEDGAAATAEGPASHPSIVSLQKRFGDAVLHWEVVAGDEHVVFVDPGRILELLGWLKEDAGQRYDFLTDVTAVDYGGGRPLQVVYQLWSQEHRRQLRVKAELPLSALEIDSAVPLWATANWLEREVYDLFGVRFLGHPDLRRIMMPENYAEGHPLRKDFPLRGRFSRAEQTRRALALDVEDVYSPTELVFRRPEDEDEAPSAATVAGGTVDVAASPEGAEVEVSTEPVAGGARTATRTVEYVVSGSPQMGPDGQPRAVPLIAEGMENPDLHGEHMLINIGPQHPATHGVLRLVLELDGETVIRCVPHIGYLHSSFEKLGEYRTWNQIIPLTDRMDYLAPLIYNCAYVMAVEKMMGITVTDRCKVVRVILMELDRIFSHLLWVGTTGIDIGAFTVFLYTFQERERIYDLHEALTGARITTSATRIGGMMADLPPGWTAALEQFLETFPETLDEVDSLLTNNNLWIGRNQNVGVIGAEDAVNYGLTGPNLRASGVAYDVRKDRPYYDYETYDFDVPVGEHGDCYDRYLVRMEEMRQSVRILRQALERLPDGPINVDDPRVILPDKDACMSDMESMIHHFKVVMEGVPAPKGESWFGVESSKGELGMYVVSDGGSKPVRWRVRGPSFINLSALPKMVEGSLLSDVIAVNASIDIVLGEIDR